MSDQESDPEEGYLPEDWPPSEDERDKEDFIPNQGLCGFSFKVVFQSPLPSKRISKGQEV